jgi:hypothetical protein
LLQIAMAENISSGADWRKYASLSEHRADKGRKSSYCERLNARMDAALAPALSEAKTPVMFDYKFASKLTPRPTPSVRPSLHESRAPMKNARRRAGHSSASDTDRVNLP